MRLTVGRQRRGRRLAGRALVAAGLAIVIACALRFRKAGTAIEPYRATTALVTSGLYRYSRNPIYTALTAVYLGLALIERKRLGTHPRPPRPRRHVLRRDRA
jgi:protein-S-isoprenylcysteine O-methyltransferase Ste14